MTHRDTVINSDGVKFLGDATSLTNRAGDQLTHVLQVHVAGHELGEGVRDSIMGLPKSSSPMPVARHRARAPAMLRP